MAALNMRCQENLTKASECIAGMPARWMAAIKGEGELDLTSARILSDHQYMWTPGGFGSRMAAFFWQQGTAWPCGLGIPR